MTNTVENAADPTFAPYSQIDVLQRVSREMDRFSVMLAQIEMGLVETYSAATIELPDELKVQLQSLDYMSQASVSISGLLSQIGSIDDADFEALVRSIKPNDLSERLQNKNLEDIDNEANKIVFF